MVVLYRQTYLDQLLVQGFESVLFFFSEFQTRHTGVNFD